MRQALLCILSPSRASQSPQTAIGDPVRQLKTVRRPPIYPNGAQAISPAAPSPPFRCPHAVHRWIRAKANRIRQRRAFDRFRHSYNVERPHEALGQRPPSRLYTSSFRPYPARISSPEYGTGVTVRSVRSTGQIKWRGQMVYVSESLRGEPVGLVQQDERTWTIHFGQLLIGLLDDSTGRVDKVPTKVLPMSPV